MHRFVWNLAWGTSGVTESDEPDDGNGDIPRGPRVAPGVYNLEFEVDGKKISSQALIVVNDPRSSASESDMKQQFDVSYKIFADSLESRRALAEIGSVKEQLSQLIDKKTAGHGDLDKKARDLAVTIEGLLSGRSEGESMGLNQANAALTAALHVAESSDRTTPSQALVLYSQAREASAKRVQEWAAVKKGSLAELNRQLQTRSLSPIAISEIEQEVYYLMTR
jgi:hypothetical protein